MDVRQILTELNLGASVAEHDSSLQTYFIETETFRRLCSDEGDVIAGDKGTGKTALYQTLIARQNERPELLGIEILPGFNPVGAPVFQRLGESGVLGEQEYIGIWKAYFLSLVGNWILAFAEGDYNEDMEQLDALLTRVGLRSMDSAPQTIFSQLLNKLRQLRPSAAEATYAATPAGIPILGVRLEFEGGVPAGPEDISRHDDALALVNRILDFWDVRVWMVMDRLDEAFQGRPDIERPALRALFRCYLDMQVLDRVRLKLFVRHDLFNRMISGGFVNLTHVNSRRIDITWDEEDLYDLLIKRLRESTEFTQLLGASLEPDALFHATFPEKVDVAERKPTTWRWMMSRISDGNEVRSPRNLIDLVLKVRDAQLRRELRSPREHETGMALIESDSIKRGLTALSNERVEDTLLAEAGELAPYIERFRNGKAEHNAGSLRELLGDGSVDVTKQLRALGFLQQVGGSYKVPILYRSGLNITQGKAFGDSDSGDNGSEDD